MRNKLTIYSIGILFFLTLVPSAFAADPFSTLAEALHDALSDDYILYAATFILFFSLIYGIFALGMRHVKTFTESGGKWGSSGDYLSRPAKVIAVSMALLADIGIYYNFTSVTDAVESIAGTIGFFGAAAFALFCAIIAYKSLAASNEYRRVVGLAAAGLGLFLFGEIADSPGATSWGIILLVIAGIWALILALKNEVGDTGRKWGKDKNYDNERKPKEIKEKERKPGQPRSFNAKHDLENGVNVVKLWWEPPYGGEIAAYEIEKKIKGEVWPLRGFLLRWQSVGVANQVHTKDNPVVDHKDINPTATYVYRIRAISPTGKKGEWRPAYAYPNKSTTTSPEPVPGVSGAGPKGSSIIGRVIFNDGTKLHPLKDIHFEVKGSINGTKTEEDGIFTLGPIHETKPYSLRIFDPSETYKERIIKKIPPFKNIDFIKRGTDIVLYPSGKKADLRLRLVDQFGKPYNITDKQNIEVFAIGGPDENLKLIYSGDIHEGAVILRDIPAGFYYNIMVHNPYTHEESEYDEDNAIILYASGSELPKPVIIKHSKEGAAVFGIVKSSIPWHTSVTEAIVTIGESGELVKTDSEGKYGLRGVSLGPNKIIVKDDAHLYLDFNADPALSVNPGENRFDISLNPGMVVPTKVKPTLEKTKVTYKIEFD